MISFFLFPYSCMLIYDAAYMLDPFFFISFFYIYINFVRSFLLSLSFVGDNNNNYY